MKYVLIPLLTLGFASAAFAGTASAPAGDKPPAACKCGAQTADACHKHCGDKCACTAHPENPPKPEPKK